MAQTRKADQSLAELTQEIGPFARQEAILYPDRVELRYKGLVRQWRHRVHLHNTKEKLDSVRNPVTGNVIARGVLLLIATALFWVLLPVTVFFAYKFFQGRRRMYVLAYGTKLDRAGRPMNIPMFFLPADKPSSQAVEKFLASFTQAHKAHLRKIQTAQSETHYITEIKQFHELREENVLSEEEFSAVKAELLGMREKKIGF